MLPWRLGPFPQDICGTVEDEGMGDRHPQIWRYRLKYVHGCVTGLSVVPSLGLWKGVVHSSFTSAPPHFKALDTRAGCAMRELQNPPNGESPGIGSCSL